MATIDERAVKAADEIIAQGVRDGWLTGDQAKNLPARNAIANRIQLELTAFDQQRAQEQAPKP